jgi:hypothetical protein
MGKKQLKHSIKLSLVTLFIFSSCQTIKRPPVKPDQRNSTLPPQPVIIPVEPVILPSVPDQPVPQVVEPTVVNPNAKLSKLRKNEKIALILSGGGAKVWGHLAVLKDLQKFKIPIVAIAGIEWGSVVAAVYAQNLSPNEVEWELAKFKDIDDWDDFLKAVFEKKSISELKIPFVCPSVNLKKQSPYLLNRGLLEQLLPFCLPSPGTIKPYSSSIAAMDHIPALVQHLRATGATKIFLINVLSQNGQSTYYKSLDSMENQIWQLASFSLKTAPVDEVINISFDNHKIDDFDDRREILAESTNLTYDQIKALAKKYGY